METENLTPHLDLELLEDYLKSLGKTVVEKMFALYCQQAEVYLNDIKEAQESDSSAGWEENCHKMKGAAASVGMILLHAKLKVLEKTVAEKEEKLILLSQLQGLNEQGIQAFKTWLASL